MTTMHEPTYTAYKVTVPNTELPVLLETARAHLRADDRYDDEYLKGVILAAASNVEKQYGLALLTQTVKQYHRGFPLSPDTPLLLRITPLVSVTSIEYVDTAGDTQVWNNAEYSFGHYNQTAFITPKVGHAWPGNVGNQPNAVTVTYQAGFGPKASNVPADIRSALLLMIGSMYENREDAPATLPTAAQNILLPYYRFSC